MIFLDNHSTTPVDSRVVAYVNTCLSTDFGNASSLDHEFGDKAQSLVEAGRTKVKKLIKSGASSKVVFTSGSTEATNLGLQGFVLGFSKIARPRIAVLPVEHKAVLATCEALRDGDLVELIYLKVDAKGQIDLDDFRKQCRVGLSLACVMLANNEIGTIYPIDEVAKIAATYGVPIFCDATQAAGKLPICFDEWGLSFLTLSAHKLYGPKGVGALVFRNGTPIKPILYGGSQEHSLRPGTLNVPGIVGFGEACALVLSEMDFDEKEISRKRDRLQAVLLTNVAGMIVNGDLDHRLAGNLHFSIPGIPSSIIIAHVRHQLAISRGAACAGGIESPSHVLTAIGLSSSLAEASLRIGVGKFNNNDEIDQAGKILVAAVSKARQMMVG